MMRVVFFDKMRETYHPVVGVVQMDNVQERVRGYQSNCWRLLLEDGSTQTFVQKWFAIHRVEI